MQSLPKIFGIIGLVVSSLSLLLASIPCFGYYALAPGMVGAVCCLMALIYLKKQQASYALSLTGLIIGLVAAGVAYYQYYRMQTILGDTIDVIQEKAKDKAKEILIREVKEVIKKELNEDNDSISKGKTHHAK